MDTSKMRKPFLPLSLTKSTLAIPRELIIDYNDGILYVKSPDGKRLLELGKTTSVQNITELIIQIIGNVNINNITLEILESRVTPIQQWKDKLVTEDGNNIVDTLIDIIKLFQDYGNSSDTLKIKLDTKVDKIKDKGLSANSFTNKMKSKLEGIEKNANKYVHPVSKACEYKAPVSSVNNIVKPSITITKEMLGLGNLDPNAKIYTHPQSLQCTPNFVSSLNGKTGNVVLTKADIYLGNVENKQPYTPTDPSHIPGTGHHFLIPSTESYHIINKANVDELIKLAADRINTPIFSGRTAAFLSFTQLLELSGMNGVGTKINSFENLHWYI